jgi:hypothetical protein
MHCLLALGPTARGAHGQHASWRHGAAPAPSAPLHMHVARPSSLDLLFKGNERRSKRHRMLRGRDGDKLHVTFPAGPTIIYPCHSSKIHPTDYQSNIHLRAGNMAFGAQMPWWPIDVLALRSIRNSLGGRPAAPRSTVWGGRSNMTTVDHGVWAPVTRLRLPAAPCPFSFAGGSAAKEHHARGCADDDAALHGRTTNLLHQGNLIASGRACLYAVRRARDTLGMAAAGLAMGVEALNGEHCMNMNTVVQRRLTFVSNTVLADC